MPFLVLFSRRLLKELLRTLFCPELASFDLPSVVPLPLLPAFGRSLPDPLALADRMVGAREYFAMYVVLYERAGGDPQFPDRNIS